MTAFDALEKLRSKPEIVKHHIALWTSVGITLIIAVAWLSTLSLAGTPTVAKETGPSPWQNIKDQWNSMRASVNGSFEYNNSNQ